MLSMNPSGNGRTGPNKLGSTEPTKTDKRLAQELTKPVIAIVDDDAQLRSTLVQVAEMVGFDARPAVDALDFHKTIGLEQTHAILLDIVMPKRDGIELLRDLADGNWRGPVVIVTGREHFYLKNAINLARGMGLNLVAGLRLPTSLEELEATFRQMLESAQPQPESCKQ